MTPSPAGMPLCRSINRLKAVPALACSLLSWRRKDRDFINPSNLILCANPLPIWPGKALSGSFGLEKARVLASGLRTMTESNLRSCVRIAIAGKVAGECYLGVVHMPAASIAVAVICAMASAAECVAA